MLGVRFEAAVVLDALDRLGLFPTLDGDDLTLVIPTYRHDLTMQDDIVEEVARIIGYENLPATLPDGPLPGVKRDPVFLLQRALRTHLVGAGISEAITYVTIPERWLDDLDAGTHGDLAGFLRRTSRSSLVRVRNPLQADREIMRPTLVPSLLEVVAANLKHESTVRIAELARVYLSGDGDGLPEERNTLAIVLAGQRDPFGRFASPGELDFFDIKGVVDSLLAGAGLTGTTVAPSTHPGLHPGRAAAYSASSDVVALVGELRPDVADAYSLGDVRVCVAEIDLDLVLAHRAAAASQVRVPRFLPVRQDFAVVVDTAIPAGEVEAAVRGGAGPLATTVTLFDVFEGTQLGEGKKSLAYRITFTAPDRALTDADLGKVRTRIERSLSQKVGGSLRG